MPTPTPFDSKWDPNHAGVVVEREMRTERAFLLRHDAYPYVVALDATVDPSGKELQDIALEYLKAANARMGIAESLIDSLGNPPSYGVNRYRLEWLPLEEPRQSYWVERQKDLLSDPLPEAGAKVDRTVVLLASSGILGLPFLGGQALRVVAHVGPPSHNVVKVRFVGVISTLPGSINSPQFRSMFASFTATQFATLRGLARVAANIPPEATDFDYGLAIRDNDSGTAPAAYELLFRTRPNQPAARESVSMAATPYALSTVFPVDANGRPSHPSVAKRPLITFAFLDAKADVFDIDPASAAGIDGHGSVKPNRGNYQLATRKKTVALGKLKEGNAGFVYLENADFRVLNSRLVDQPESESVARQIPTVSAAKPRSDEFAAANAFHHTNSFFSRMRRYGLAPKGYFRYFDLPLAVHYRSGIVPGFGDGRLVNAQVRFAYLWPTNGILQRGLEVRFAMGDMQSSAGKSPANLPSAKEKAPLGVATDLRWCWHEFGHVLVAGAVGDLELRFAHSPGDALAAIAADPESLFACDRNGAAANDGGWRGVTFPWIHIPRRHDRDVTKSWAWCGVLNQSDAYGPTASASGEHGYWSEQILSSSLFRMYRAIGGDNCETAAGKRVPAVDDRRRAADYAIYLIMRAIQLLGPGNVTPCDSARVFVDALCKADCGTDGEPGPGGYVGGSVRKVARWAFERQGLYGIPLPGSTICGPEDPAEVDLHIDDRRAKHDGPYTATDLRSDAWHATEEAIEINPPWPFFKHWWIYVKVLNRGPADAAGTVVEVWFAALAQDGSIPAFPGNGWKTIGKKSRTVPRHSNGEPGSALFGGIARPFNWLPPAKGRYAILVAASCTADRSNIDGAAQLPCASIATPLHLLVPFDNNLGLRIINVR